MKFFSYICKCVALDTGMCEVAMPAISFALYRIKRTFVTSTSDTLQSMFTPPPVLTLNNKEANHLRSSYAGISLATSRRKRRGNNHIHLITHDKWRPLTERGVATCRIF